jgi:hypothetical protein
MVDANYTMTNFNGVSDEARNQVIVLEGTNTAQRNLIAPLVEKTYTIKNTTTGGFAVQIIGSSGVGVVIPNGVTTTVYCDGLNFYTANTGVPGNFTVAGNLAVTGTSTFTGIPTGPTAAVGTNTTQLATTAFVRSIIPAGVILMWSGSIASIPSGWLLCNGTSGTPDLRDRFVVGAGSTYAVAATGGGATTTLIEANLPSHTHSISASGTTSATNIDHLHSIAGSGTTSGQNTGHTHGISDPGHVHGLTNLALYNDTVGGGPNGILTRTNSGNVTDSAVTGITGTQGVSNDHNHTFSFSGNSGAMNTNQAHTHTVTVTGTSGATGSGTAFSSLPPYYALAYIMKS